MRVSHEAACRANASPDLAGKGLYPLLPGGEQPTAETRWIRVKGGLHLHLRLWPGEGVPFLLLHGLASNSRMWDVVAEHLHTAGHPVAALDQRGHGCSDTRSGEYDFSALCEDVVAVLDGLGWASPVVVGQSWGGNVALAFAAAHANRCRGVGLVDGGVIDLQGRFDGNWEQCLARLHPPDVSTLEWGALEALVRKRHPTWTERAVAAMLTNYERLPSGKVRPRLSPTCHRELLFHLWAQRPQSLYSHVVAPVVLCVAQNGHPELELREVEVAAAAAKLRCMVTHRFADTSHDIHVHRPHRLAWTLLREVEAGFWSIHA